jgi:hypothetical protein
MKQVLEITEDGEEAYLEIQTLDQRMVRGLTIFASRLIPVFYTSHQRDL